MMRSKYFSGFFWGKDPKTGSPILLARSDKNEAERKHDETIRIIISKFRENLNQSTTLFLKPRDSSNRKVEVLNLHPNVI
jgi:hypothetical protein